MVPVLWGVHWKPPSCTPSMRELCAMWILSQKLVLKTRRNLLFLPIYPHWLVNSPVSRHQKLFCLLHVHPPSNAPRNSLPQTTTVPGSQTHHHWDIICTPPTSSWDQRIWGGFSSAHTSHGSYNRHEKCHKAGVRSRDTIYQEPKGNLTTIF